MTERRILFRPSRKRIAAWLAGDVADEALERHLEHSERSARIVEELLAESGELDDGDFDLDLADAIREIYEPPADLDERIVRTVAERRRADEEFGLFVGMFGVAADALDLLAGGERDDDRDRRTDGDRAGNEMDGPADGSADEVEES